MIGAAAAAVSMRFLFRKDGSDGLLARTPMGITFWPLGDANRGFSRGERSGEARCADPPEQRAFPCLRAWGKPHGFPHGPHPSGTDRLDDGVVRGCLNAHGPH